MRVKNQVKLKPKERKLIKQLISKGIEKARKITRCRILLLADEGKTDTQIIEALKTARNTIRQVRTRYVKEGLETAINEQSRPGAPKGKNYSHSLFTGSRGAEPLDIASNSRQGG